ncbi:Cullin family [Carpediemonas membranifera]|uniref:Cullin family n=1 Tax=Carpediemonas membranifera TaxID=201153 RepID=A0A8J6B6A1_9EUKA|nr:Cullin family [Carpediemonas membranifera]|eukprot:KAG9396558.1 Cullin family [Carpediemonas membranifera]
MQKATKGKVRKQSNLLDSGYVTKRKMQSSPSVLFQTEIGSFNLSQNQGLLVAFDPSVNDILPPMPSVDYYSESWANLKAILTATQTDLSSITKQPCAMLYDTVVHICRCGFHSRLCDDLSACMVQHARDVASAHTPTTPAATVRNLAAMWARYKRLTKTVCAVFAHLDMMPGPTVLALCIAAFRDAVMPRASFSVLVGSVLPLLSEARKGGAGQADLVQQLQLIFDMATALGFLDSQLEATLAAHTAEYYTAALEAMVAAHPGAAFYLEAVRVLDFESGLVDEIIGSPRITADIRAVVLDVLITRRTAELLEAPSFRAMVDALFEGDAAMEPPMTALGRLMGVSNAALLQTLFNITVDRVSAIAAASLAADELVLRTTAALHQAAHIASRCFGGNSAVLSRLRGAVGEAVLRHQDIVLGAVATHLDHLLTASNPKAAINPGVDIQTHVRLVIAIFRRLEDKDMFEKEFGSAMRRRLLGGERSNGDIEALVISSLKQECGESYTERLEAMQEDVDDAEVLAQPLRDALPPHLKDVVTMVAVNQTHWGLPDALAPTLPDDLLAAHKTFEAIHTAGHPTHKLEFSAEESTVDLALTLGGAETTVRCPLLAGLILMLLGPVPAIGLKEAIAAVGVTEVQFMAAVAPLIDAGVVMRRGANLALNDGYTGGPVNLITEADVTPEPKPAAGRQQRRATDDSFRDTRIDVFVIKLLKKETAGLPMDAVVDSVQRMVADGGFNPVDIEAVKGRLEHLIDHEYIKRSDDDMSVLQYMID